MQKHWAVESTFDLRDVAPNSKVRIFKRHRLIRTDPSRDFEDMEPSEKTGMPRYLLTPKQQYWR